MEQGAEDQDVPRRRVDNTAWHEVGCLVVVTPAGTYAADRGAEIRDDVGSVAKREAPSRVHIAPSEVLLRGRRIDPVAWFATEVRVSLLRVTGVGGRRLSPKPVLCRDTLEGGKARVELMQQLSLHERKANACITHTGHTKVPSIALLKKLLFTL